MRLLVLLVCLILAACSGHPSPPQPEGNLILIDPPVSARDIFYNGEIY